MTRLQFRRFVPSDLAEMDLAGVPREGVNPWCLVGEFSYVAERNGRVAAGGFVLPVAIGRAVAFANFERIERADWPRLIRFIRGVLRAAHLAGYWRIEADVAASYAPGHRLLLYLGFSVEGLAEAYGPDGEDHVMYAHVDRAILARHVAKQSNLAEAA